MEQEIKPLLPYYFNQGSGQYLTFFSGQFLDESW
jgi:hypothetical protein